MNKELIFPVYEFRPLNVNNNTEIRRYANGKWMIDDGEHDLAFTEIGNCAPMCYYVYLPHTSNIIWSWAIDGQWEVDVPNHPGKNPWHYFLRNRGKEFGSSWDINRHPNFIARESGMKFVCDAVGCANGSGLYFNIGDEHILAGLLREKETKNVVRFPKKFICMYCGELDTSIDKRLKQYMI